jgi:hypothetical protein
MGESEVNEITVAKRGTISQDCVDHARLDPKLPLSS